MTDSVTSLTWIPSVEKTNGPMYLSIADAIAEDIKRGVLKPGQRLPPQRALADALNIDFTTVSRAYAAAGKKNLVEGRVGQGTYVRELVQFSREEQPSARDRTVDMSMNMPPRFDNPEIVQEMWRSLQDLGQRQSEDFLMRYQSPGGSDRDAKAARKWLDDRFGLTNTDQVVLCNGVQGALLSILSMNVNPGAIVCHEAITYPGFFAVAKYLNLKTVAVEMDEDGLLPDALKAICKQHRPAALYTVPTLNNPTTATQPEQRRQKIAAIAAKYNLSILEDDAYGAIAVDAPPPLAKFAPDHTWHICSMSKCLAPSLRVCFVTPPQASSSAGLKRAIKANGGLVSPISAALATTWINTGIAEQVTDAIRQETKIRQAAFSEALPDIALKEGAFHVWMPLPNEISATEFAFTMRASSTGIVPGQAFTNGAAPNAVRIALGSADTANDLRENLRGIADALKNPGEHSWMVV